jgi:hypothetical protein
MSITDWISQFLFDRKIRGLTPGTIAYHDKSLRRFKQFCQSQGIHTFRRLFALTMLRNGTDIVTLSRLMGHSTTDILKKYLAQTDEDLREASAKASPIDNAL